MEATVSIKRENKINGRGVWHYEIDSPLGMINVVDYEQADKTIKRFLFDGQEDEAGKKFRVVSTKMLNGKI